MKRLLSLLACGGLLFLLVACSSSAQAPLNTPPVTAAPSPTPTTRQGPPVGTVLYQADWSHGSSGSAGWKIVNGMLQSDGSENDTLTIPSTLTVANYALEFRFQIVNVVQNGGYLTLKALRSSSKDGYVAGILNLLVPGAHSEFLNPSAQVYLDPEDDMEDPAISRPSDYEPGTYWHMYRIEVQDSSVSFLADGNSKGTAISSKTAQLSNGPLQLISSGAIVRLSSLRILAL